MRQKWEALGKHSQKKLTNPFILIEEGEMRGFSLVSHKIGLASFRNVSLEGGKKPPLRIKY